jgi:hypothetical protein
MSSNFGFVDLLDILPSFFLVVNVGLPFVPQEAFRFDPSVDLFVQVLDVFVVTTSAIVLGEVVLTLFPSSIAVTSTGLPFAGALNPFNIFPSGLEVVLLPLNSILNVFVCEDLDAVVVRPVGVLVRKDFDFLEPFVRDLAIVFQGAVCCF